MISSSAKMLPVLYSSKSIVTSRIVCKFTHSLCVQRFHITSSRCLTFYPQVMGLKHNLPLAGSFLDISKKYSTIKTLDKTENVRNVKDQAKDLDLKPDAVDIFKTAIRAVRPKAMIENVLQYNRITSTLKVQEKVYNINRNVFIVGFGNAVLGMARVVEDMLGEHVVTGIISIPRGLQEEIKNSHSNEMFLGAGTKIHVYEGSSENEVDETGHNASKAIHRLVSNLVKTDLLIVLCSGGGSTLCPSPEPPITLKELNQTTQLLLQKGAKVTELNAIRKNIEVLKGGGLALAARPAQVLSLILSSVIGDAADLVASGPTCSSQPTPHHCLEILHRLDIIDKIPENVKKYLEKEAKSVKVKKSQTAFDHGQSKAERDKVWQNVQNIIVGNNSIACQAAAARASELGYFPLILTTVLTGEARRIGILFAKLSKFIMICYDRRAGLEPNSELSMLELELVAGGIRKEWMNHISNSVNKAHNMNKDICVIAGADLDVQVKGTGIGGKNMEAALAAAIQMQEEFRVKEMKVTESHMCFLSCDSDGYDGATEMAGAVVDQALLDKVEESGVSMKEYLTNNDSFTFFREVNNGGNIVRTNLTGTNIMDVVILIVQMPKEKKYKWNL